MARGRIVINEIICKGCEFCAAVCPYQLIYVTGHYNLCGYRPAALLDSEGRCTGCMLCAMICPEAAITVFREVKQVEPQFVSA
ncbi:MAG: 4Fe-4S binding protein [Anaerolineae bacterium]|nr:4Fe-4S binding protein [Anaerolineae bacterium]